MNNTIATYSKHQGKRFREQPMKRSRVRSVGREKSVEVQCEVDSASKVRDASQIDISTKVSRQL